MFFLCYTKSDWLATPEPVRRYVEQLEQRMILDAVSSTSTPEVTLDITPEVRLLSAFAGEMTRQQLKEVLRLKDDEHFRKAYLLPALNAGWIEMTIPDKPRSSKQKYRLTEKGRQLIAQHGDG